MDVSIDDVSLAVSYCKDYDRDLFLEIEADGKNQYSHTKIQNLEYAIKSISFQVYYNLENIKYLAELIKTSKNVLGSYKGIESKLLMNYSVLVDELFQLYPLSQMISEVPFAELKVYEALEKLGKNFYIFHSVQWLKKTKKWAATWKEKGSFITSFMV